MATKKVTQKPILETDVKASQVSTPKKTAPKKSRKRVSIDEYAIVNDLRPEVKAGFKAWLKGNIFHFDEEWDALFEQYKNRTL